MKQFSLFIASLIICVFSSILVSAQTSERTIKFIRSRNEPLEIKRLEISGKEISFNQSFRADDNDWFHDLSVSVKNVSGQTIHFIQLGITFDSSEADGISTEDALLYGCIPPPLSEASTIKCDPPLKPNQTATLVLKDYERTRKLLTETGIPQIINGFELRIGEVFFADERLWSSGQVHKRNQMT